MSRATSTVDTASPSEGRLYYAAFFAAKGGVTRAGTAMCAWDQMDPLTRAAFQAAGEAARGGSPPMDCYSVYLATRAGRAWDGSTAPEWEGLQDQAAWTAGAEAARGVEER